MAVLYFDLDDFKQINTALGTLLVAMRLLETLRIGIEVVQPEVANNIIARMGGDELLSCLTELRHALKPGE